MFNCSPCIRKYAFGGFAFGLCFPLCAILLDQFTIRTQWTPLLELITSNPLHLIIMLAPFVLGGVFALLGREHDQAVANAESRHAKDYVFKLLVDGVSDYAIFMLDVNGHVLNWNNGAQRVKGYTSDEIVGQHCSIFHSAVDRKAKLPDLYLAESLREGKFSDEGWRYRKDGTRFWAQIVIDPIFDDAGTHIGFAKITRDRTEEKLNADRIAHLARHDALTGLPNRLGFLDKLDIAIERAAVTDGKIAIVNIDLDRFKEINDTHGHGHGDRLLELLARRMLDVQVDGEFMARFGGDEFVGFKAYSDHSELKSYLAQLQQIFSTRAAFADVEIQPGASIGVSIFPDDSFSRDQLIGNADLAMYRAKDSAETNVCFFEPSMDETERDRRALAADLRVAMDEGQFFLVYQQQRCANSEKIIGYEALLRWRHPTRGLVPPAVFIPIAEESGLIVQLGAWVIQTACNEAVSFNLGHRVAINISAIQLESTHLVDLVRSALLTSGMAPALLEIEVTESAFVHDKQQALHVLRQLKATGITVAIDDFGIGYSSLDTLRTFPFDRIKIDRSFITNVEHDRQSQAILRAVIALGRSLGVTVVAEGVETRSQMAILEHEGCNAVQGFLFGQPAQLNSLQIEQAQAGLRQASAA